MTKKEIKQAIKKSAYDHLRTRPVIYWEWEDSYMTDDPNEKFINHCQAIFNFYDSNGEPHFYSQASEIDDLDSLVKYIFECSQCSCFKFYIGERLVK